MGSTRDEHEDAAGGAAASLRPASAGRRRGRRALRAALVLALVGAALVLAAHAPPARAWALRQAAAWLHGRYGLVLAAGRLDYRLTSLALSVHRVSLATAETPARPFLRAERITVLLSPAVLVGRPAFRHVEVVNPRLAFGTEPARTGAPTPAREDGGTLGWLGSLEIATLAVQGLDLVAGRPDVAELRASGVSLDARGDGPGRLRGRLGIARGGSLVAPGTHLRLDGLAGDVALAGGALEVERLTARLPGGGLVVGGRLHLATPRALDLRYDGDVDLAEARRWFVAQVPLRGRAVVAGAVTGTLEDPRATFEASGTRIAWADGPEATVSASGTVTGRGLEIGSLSVRAPWVAMTGRGHLAFGRHDSPSRFTGEWQVPTLSALAPLVAVPPARLPRAGASGSVEVQWPGPAPALSSVAGGLRARVVAHTGSGGQPGEVVLEGGAGQWRWRQRQSLAGDTEATVDLRVRLEPAEPGRSTLGGTLTVRAANVAAALRDLRAVGVPRAAAEWVASGRLEVAGRVGGTVAAPRLDAQVKASEASVAGIAGLSAHGAVRLDAHRLDVAPLVVEDGVNRVELVGSLGLTGAGGRGRFEVLVADAARLGARWDARVRPSGTLGLIGEWTGPLTAPAVRAAVSGGPVRVGATRLDTVSGTVSVESRVLSVHDLRAAQGDAWLRLDGRADLASRAIALDLSSRGFDVRVPTAAVDPGAAPDGTPVEIEGLTLEAVVRGTLDQPEGTATARSPAVTVAGRALGEVDARLTVADGTLRVDVGAAPLSGRAIGHLRLAEPWSYDVETEFANADLRTLLAAAGVAPAALVDVSASFSATGRASGTLARLVPASATVQVRALDGTVRGRRLSLVEPGSVRLDGDRIDADRIAVTLGGATVRVQGGPDAVAASGGTIEATADVPLGELLTFMPTGTAETAWTADGVLLLAATWRGPIDDPVLTGRVEAKAATIRRGGRDVVRDGRLEAAARDGVVTVAACEASVLGSAVEARGAFPLGWIVPGGTPAPASGSGARPPATLSARATVAVAPLLQALGRDLGKVAGTVQVAIDGQADAPRVDTLKATLVADTAALTLGEMTFEQAAPTRLSLAGGRLTVDALEWTGRGARVVADGSLGLGPGVHGDLRVQGRTALRVIDSLLPARAFGTTTFDLQVSGPPGTRAVAGWVDLDEVSFVSREYGAALSGWSGRVEMGPEGIALRQLRGQLNGGDVELDGTLPLRANGVGRPPLSIKARDVFLEQPAGLRSRLDADVTWTASGGTGRITGSATIGTEAYREPVTRMARMVASLGGTRPGETARLPAFLAGTELDVALEAAGPLRIENSLGRIELAPHLTLTGTLGQPALAGSVDIADDGRVQLQGRSYRLTESRLDFAPADGFLPRLNINGIARIGQYDVYLRLRGPLDAIETNLASDPPLSERDLQTLVVTGQAGEAVAGGQGGDAFAVGAVSGDLLGFAGQFLGLDSVRISNESFELVSSDVNPATRLTVSERFLGRFEVVLSENLDDNTLTWILIYHPRAGLEVRVASLDNTEQTVEFRQEIAFGPGGSRRAKGPAASAGARPAREVVDSTTFTGRTGPDSSRLTGALRLTRGDTFDYRAWREDVERLERVFFEAGYYGARVVPKRTLLDASGDRRRVALEYRVVRGPATELVVVGSPDTRGLRDHLAVAWSRSDFPDFLDEELASAARAFLADRGFLRATADARIDTPAAGARRATVTVDPGPRSTVRRLVFEGHEGVSTATLAALAERDGLDRLAWSDPQPLVAAVSAFYASRGHLAATVTVAPVEFSDATATLRVRIVEGPQARVGAIRFAGVAPARGPAAVGAVGLASGSPFAAGDDRAARVRLERAYRDLGFRDARVAVASTIDDTSASVDLTFTVTEGPQHVLRRVRVTGLESTHPSLVDGVVDLAAGTPAGQARIAATQRRLYELGVFGRADVRLAPVTGPAVEVPPGVTEVDATVAVEEVRRYVFRYGIEVSNDSGAGFEDVTGAVGVAADLRDRNFLGQGLALGAGARYENNLKSLRSIFTVPRWLGRPIRTNVYGTWRLERDTSDQDVVVDDDERALTLEQRWRPARSLELSWGYVFDWRDIRLSRPDRTPAVDFRGALASLNVAAIVDRRDAIFDATRGWFHSSSLQWGLQALGSDFDYVRYLFRLFRYDRVGPVVLASAARWGRIWEVGGRAPLTTLDLLFKAGGSQTVRGYAQDSLSALELLGVPLGGTRLVILNGEVRFPVHGWVGGVLFADAGNTFADRGVSLEDLAVGLGVGLRIRTPIAPIRVDLGFPVPRRPGDPRYRWHFSIGQVF